jgi:polysaccharide export outer membrane protein
MTASWPPREVFRYAVLCAWLAVLAATGGASRADESQQMAVRIAALLLIFVTLWTPRRDRLREQRVPLLFAAACIALVMLQLVPLPFAVWRVLPGHGFYTNLAEPLGVAPVARPWSLTPDLTVNALLACLPPLATLVAILSMPRADRVLLVAPVFTLAVAGAILGLGQIAGGITSPLRLYRVTNAGEAVGFFANRNHHALMMAIGITLLGPIHAMLRVRTMLRSMALPVVIALGSVLGLSVLAAGSRAGLIAAVLATLGTILWSRASDRNRPVRKARQARRGRWLRPTLVGLALMILPASLLTLAITGSHAPALERLLHTQATGESRYISLPALARTAEVFLPLGSGFGSFDPVYRRFEPAELLTPHYANEAHNDLLQIAIEGGVPAVALLALFLTWWSRRGFALVRPGQQGSADARDMGRLGLLQTMLMLAFSLVDYPLRTPLLGSIFVIACVSMLRRPAPRIRRLSPEYADALQAPADTAPIRAFRRSAGMRTRPLLPALLCLFAAACASDPPFGAPGQKIAVTTQTVLPPPTGADLVQSVQPYLIGPFDTLTITVFGVPDLSGDVQTDASGRLSLPLVGMVEAAGQTPTQLSHTLATRLAHYVRDPQVTINLKDAVSQTFTVDGQVNEPGIFPVVGNMSLMRAVATAKGMTEFAKLDDVVVFRTVGRQPMAALYNLGAIRRGIYPDPAIYSNDVIVVGNSRARRMMKDMLQLAPALATPLVIALQ